jgi:hypothetical protein
MRSLSVPFSTYFCEEVRDSRPVYVVAMAPVNSKPATAHFQSLCALDMFSPRGT